MKLNKLFVGLLSLSLVSTLFSCGGNGSSELTIVHFDQTILGDTQKELGVSIGVKKGNTEFKNKLNDALSLLTTEERNQLMTEAVDRSTGNYETSKSLVYSVPTENTLGTIVVGLECNYAPFNWTDNKANEFNYPIKGQSGLYAEGYDIQVARYLANELNYGLEVVSLGWEGLIPALNAGTINVVIAGMTDTEERRQEIDFTNEYYISELVLIVKKDSKLASATSLEEFRGTKIVSQVSTVTDDVIETWKSEYNVTHLNPLDTFATCAIAVQNGSADAMTAELPVANSIVNGSK